MTKYLCISAIFLDRLFHGKADDEEPEWPPSPMRLFQALLAGSRTGYRSNAWTSLQRDALAWLERRGPPIIIAPKARPATTYKLFVPRNDSDRIFNREDRLTEKHVRPYRLMGGDTIYYLWPLEEEEEPVARVYIEQICRMARNMICLGWGIDQIIGNGLLITEFEAATLPGERWKAWSLQGPGQPALRVPQEGSLKDLEQTYNSYLQRVDRNRILLTPKPTKFARKSYLRSTKLPIRPYAAFELSEGVVFPQTDTVKIAAMLRSATCRLAQADTHAFPGGTERYVAGHVDNEKTNPPRFSYLPLPSIGHPHADGMIRRLIIAEPYGGDGAHARWAQNRLHNSILTDQDGRERGVLLKLWTPAARAMVRRYVSESRSWCTVTPVILPGHDEFGKNKTNKMAKAERLLMKSLLQSGLTPEMVESVYMRKAPFFPGSQHPDHYRRPDYLANRSERPGWHVWIEFREPVVGPMSVGAGRHVGLGLFAPGPPPAGKEV